MESIYPYRVAWHKPKPVNVRPESRRTVLEALEHEFPTSRSRLLGLADLGAVTVRRACHQLIREEVMALKYGRDPDSGQSCDLVTFTRYPVLPVLELAETYMIWRLCDTLGGSVFATVRDRGGFYSAEDDLGILMGQVSTILKAGTCRLPGSIPLQPPVLLLPSPMNSPDISRGHSLSRDPEQLTTLVRRVLDETPVFVLTPEEATAHELCYHPAARGAACVLHVRFGVTVTASLLIRQTATDLTSPWIPAPYADGVSVTLNEYIHNTPAHSAARWKRVAACLGSICRLITPHLVVIETDSPHPIPDSIRAVLPPMTALQYTGYALNTPSLAHRGALRFSRRALWESMRQEPPSIHKGDRHVP